MINVFKLLSMTLTYLIMNLKLSQFFKYLLVRLSSKLISKSLKTRSLWKQRQERLCSIRLERPNSLRHSVKKKEERERMMRLTEETFRWELAKHKMSGLRNAYWLDKQLKSTCVFLRETAWMISFKWVFYADLESFHFKLISCLSYITKWSKTLQKLKQRLRN